MKHVCIMP